MGGAEITRQEGNFGTLAKKTDLDGGQGQKLPCPHLGQFLIEFLTGKKIWVSFTKFREKNYF
jgi:hypothetical protein